MTDQPPSEPPRRNRLIEINLDQKSLAPRANQGSQHDRDVAIYDLLDENSFALHDRDDGPGVRAVDAHVPMHAIGRKA